MYTSKVMLADARLLMLCDRTYLLGFLKAESLHWEGKDSKIPHPGRPGSWIRYQKRLENTLHARYQY